MRQAAAERKTFALLRSGRVRVLEATTRGGRAIVVGDVDDYEVVVRDGLARCTCPGFHYRKTCAHAQAAALVAGVSRGPFGEAS